MANYPMPTSAENDPKPVKANKPDGGGNGPVTDPGFNPSGNEAVAVIKNEVVRLEQIIRSTVPDGRRRSVALTKLEDFSMWAVKAAVVGDD